MMTIKIKHILVGVSLLALTSCVTNNIQPVGMLGPNRLKVYVIKNNDFLSASRMLVILDKKGNVSAYSGNTVSGAGAVSLQAAESALNAGAIVIGAKAIQHGLENASVKGIPSTVKVQSDHNININASVTKY